MIQGDDRLTPGPDNLVIRAAETLRNHAQTKLGARLTLQKAIPQGAGLGGGSSNAAAALLLLSKLWNLDVPPQKISEMGATLGSDVPFFLQPFAARGTGRGEILDPVPLKNPPWAVLIHPGFGSPTAAAYATYAQDPRPGSPGSPLQLKKANGGTLTVLPKNDLEPAVEGRFLWIDSAREWMGQQQGVLSARMSGSGSTVFGLFSTETLAQTASENAKSYFGPESWIRVARLLGEMDTA